MIWLSCALLMVSAFGLIRRVTQYRQAADEYAAIERDMLPQETEAKTPAMAKEDPAVSLPDPKSPAQAALPAATAAPALYYNDRIRKLKVQNSDTVGYLQIDGTSVSYPVVQGKDNDYYQTHTFSGKNNPSGAIFLDSANSPDLYDFNTILYGHNMKDGSMFHDLLQYRKATFAGGHDKVVLTGLYTQRTYRIFSAYTCSPAKDMRGFGCVSAVARLAFLDTLLGRSDINPGRNPLSADSRILTLITCREDSDRDYFVVHAVLEE